MVRKRVRSRTMTRIRELISMEMMAASTMAVQTRTTLR